MSTLPSGGPTSRCVEEDILVPILARLAAISTSLDLAPPPPTGDAGEAKLQATALLEKVRRQMLQLEGVFRRIDNTEKAIRYSFDSVEKQLDDALQHEQRPDAEHIHANLLAVDARIRTIKASIRQAYNIPCGDEPSATPPTQISTSPGTETAMTKKMGEVLHGPQMNHLRLAVGGLEERLRGCALCLAAFPEGAVIKKRLLLHWWLAEGFVRSAVEGKARFGELLARGFIIPAPTSALCGTVHRCTVRPWMRDLLVSVAKRHGFLELNAGDIAFARRACLRGGGMAQQQPPVAAGFSAWVRAIYNVGHKYVELDERWFAGKRDLRVLQLGQWREFSTREQMDNPMDSHIEASGVERLRDMGNCKNLSYISFRGISRIETLPDSIGKLRELRVLDLRACHNLEQLGQGITRLDRLEYLDLSECHLLVGMPRGLGQLAQLEILKGFVVANSNSRDFCHLNELTKLEKLRKLGIVIGKMAVPNENEFMKLAQFKALQSLKISWGLLNYSTKSGITEAASRHSVATMKYALPPNLKKLDLHCFPFADFAQWVQPTGVRKLYIRGGKLATLGDGEVQWEAEVLRLRFLTHLHCDFGRLQSLFRNLKPEKTEIHECPNFIHDSAVGESSEIDETVIEHIQ
ncbi:unnamed protein product [Urochloa humidicola]